MRRIHDIVPRLRSSVVLGPRLLIVSFATPNLTITIYSPKSHKVVLFVAITKKSSSISAMSHGALPIDAKAFAEALESLPIDALHAKVAEIQNSISHLKSSNDQMMPFAEEGDDDCKAAMFENLVVIGRMNDRIQLLRGEVERRGLRWADGEVEDEQNRKRTTTDGTDREATGSQNTTATAGRGSGSLTDQELRDRMAAQMEDDDEVGVHL